MPSAKIVAALGIAAVLMIAMGAAVCFVCVPYEAGPRHQEWTVTVTDGAHTGSSSGFGLGRCGDEGPQGAAVTRQAALARACFAAGLCPGDSVCDCSSHAHVVARCEGGSTPGRTRLGDHIRVPVH